MQTSNRVFALIPCSLAWPKTLADRGGNGAQLRYIEAFIIYRAIYILTQLAAPGVRRGINPPARPGDYRRGHQRYRHQISRGRQRRIPENSAADCRSGISRICWKIDCQGELNRLPRLITAGWRSTDMDARHIEEISIREWPSSARPSRGK